MGRPVVGSIYGGLAEFMNERNSFSVDFEEEGAGEAWCNGGKWAVPSQEHIKAHMRRIYKDRQLARYRGNLAAADVMGMTWKDSAIKALEAMESLGAFR